MDDRSGSDFKTLLGHGMSVNAVSFSPDRNFLVSASCDGTSKLILRCLYSKSSLDHITYFLNFCVDFVLNSLWDEVQISRRLKNCRKLINIQLRPALDFNGFLCFARTRVEEHPYI